MAGRADDRAPARSGGRARGRFAWAQLLTGAAFVGAVVAALAAQGAADEPKRPAPEPPAAAQERTDAEPPQRGPDALLRGFDPLDTHMRGGRLVSPLDGGERAELTVEPGLQQHIHDRLAHYEVPYASLVALQPHSGRVLAYVSQSRANPGVGDLARDPTPPAASVFKVVTAAALVDAGVEADKEVCYGGGARKLRPADLEDDPERDRWCATLGKAMGRSLNAVFAKLADRHLDAPTLERYATAFGFGHALPFDAPTRPSPAEVPTERLERARTAAGFWHMHMSPLHGALIAATIANGGKMPRAAIVDRVVAPDGEVRYAHEPTVFRNVIPRRTAKIVGEMMTNTVDGGTAKSWFFDPQGRPFLPDTEVAGKTGTLTGSKPYRAYNWFIGYAPADEPKIAVAALVVNKPRWRIKAGYVAREAMRWYLFEGPGAEAGE